MIGAFIQFNANSNHPVGYIICESGCWEWVGSLKKRLYGGLWHPTEKRMVYAHIYFYQQKHGPIPEGLELDHLCRNPTCVNPDHLEPVTHAENMRRGSGWAGQKVRQTHCKRGHPLEPGNLLPPDPSNPQHAHHRRCLICARANRKYHYRKNYQPHPRQARTHCPEGHELTSANLVLSRLKRGHKVCRTCTRAKANRYNHEHGLRGLKPQ